MNRFDGEKWIVAVVCTTVFLFGFPFTHSRSHAIPLPGFTGHTDVGPAIMNFAVLSPFDPFSSVLAGAYVPAQGNPNFDPSKYTYLYQVAVPTSSNRTFTSFQPQFALSTPVSTTSIGSFASPSGNFRLDFLNGGSIVNAIGNNLQGPNSFGIAARTVSGPAQIGISSNPSLYGSQVHPYWTFLPQGALGLTAGVTSPLVGYQSNIAPTFSSGWLDAFIPGGIPAGKFASVPNAIAPEPGTVVLFCSGFVGLAVWRRKRSACAGRFGGTALRFGRPRAC